MVVQGKSFDLHSPPPGHELYWQRSLLGPPLQNSWPPLHLNPGYGAGTGVYSGSLFNLIFTRYMLSYKNAK